MTRTRIGRWSLSEVEVIPAMNYASMNVSEPQCEFYCNTNALNISGSVVPPPAMTFLNLLSGQQCDRAAQSERPLLAAGRRAARRGARPHRQPAAIGQPHRWVHQLHLTRRRGRYVSTT